MSGVNDSVSGQISFGSELVRKGTHMGALAIPGSYYILDLTKSEMLLIWGAAAALMIFIDIARLRGWPFWERLTPKFVANMIRPHETVGDFTGATYILMAVCLTVALFDRPIAVAALGFIIVGDTLAALIGRRFGRHRFGHKSVEGSLACLAGTLLVAALAPEVPAIIGVSGAVVAAVAEALPWKIDDNISVPLLSGLTMTLATRILVTF